MSLADREQIRRNRNDVATHSSPRPRLFSKLWFLVALIILAFIVILIIHHA